MNLYLKNVKGRETKKNINKYKVKWDKPSKSKLQFAFKQLLKPLWIGHAVYEEFPVYGTLQRVDFINLTLNIAFEVNGKQHDVYTPHFHKNPQGFLKSLRLDKQKADWLELNDFRLIEVMEQDLNKFSPKYIKENFDIDIVIKNK